ncbi:MAG: LLM class F420-dependent oxidoreductase [Pseudonocardiales bacterium]|nr:LLM class F420-dependent oxidoreductase [Pseudonocardiales bacterium]MBV9652199.1 LLM class F420-dependent oxidoreductase [Pseudonocardiales bacterium]
MDFRIFTEPQQGATYQDQLRVARTAEDAGYDAFFRSDHYLRIGEGSGEPGPTDAWATLAGLALQTSTIRLGTLVSPATFRLPGPLAIIVAQVDQMAGGRVELGMGSGWYADEHAAYGIPFPPLPERFDRYAEQVEIVTGLWRTPLGQRYSFAGRHYQLTDSPALPKPAQQPHPPLIIGGTGARRTPMLAAQFANEYNVAFSSIETTKTQFDRVSAACSEIGRDPAEIRRSAALVVAVARDEAELVRRAEVIGRTVEDLRANGIAGLPAEAVDRLGTWRAHAGIERIYLQLLDLSDLDQIELIAAEVMPQLR